MDKTTKYISELVREYKYRRLPFSESQKALAFYRENLNGFLEDGGGEVLLPDGTPFASSYTRIVIGDYGAYLEFTEDAVVHPLETQKGQEWRTTPRYAMCKYEWLCPRGHQDSIKVYKQRGRVRYADYIPGYLYVAVMALRRGDIE